MGIFIWKVMVLWIAVDTFLIATGWFLTITVRPLWPAWWRRVIADEVSGFVKL